VDADGKKMLLVEEIQSDWHQAGREKGYATRESLEKWYNQNKLENDPAFADLNSEQIKIAERNRSAGLGGESVPDAPFKDTWYQLSLKRLLKYAADNGYERVGLTTGKQQIEDFPMNCVRMLMITFQTGQKLTPSEADELQALRSKTYMTGTETTRYDICLAMKANMLVRVRSKRLKGQSQHCTGTVKDGKFIDGQK
jgi:hypothetical protein